MSSITVFSTPSCVQCRATYRSLDRSGLAYTVVDVTEDDAARATVTALGYVQAPVVMVGSPEQGEHWSGFRPDRIEALARQLATVGA
ncbi:glutaredoxin domain-containing protein [Kineococcus gynurae]|uniref:Glutaredoxin domain-containing protein n=1 Tax=Kineococcus gynurae TaxID=452979 RepID=A0ABV5LP74_9ACTN